MRADVYELLAEQCGSSRQVAAALVELLSEATLAARATVRGGRKGEGHYKRRRADEA